MGGVNLAVLTVEPMAVVGLMTNEGGIEWAGSDAQEHVADASGCFRYLSPIRHCARPSRRHPVGKDPAREGRSVITGRRREVLGKRRPRSSLFRTSNANTLIHGESGATYLARCVGDGVTSASQIL